jgi:hypothetical protein
MGTMHRWVAIAVVVAGAQLIPATARADLHNITYVARVDGVAPGSTATFITADNRPTWHN